MQAEKDTLKLIAVGTQNNKESGLKNLKMTDNSKQHFEEFKQAFPRLNETQLKGVRDLIERVECKVKYKKIPNKLDYIIPVKQTGSVTNIDYQSYSKALENYIRQQ